MREITIRNPRVLDTPYTYVSTDYTSGATLYVEDSDYFADNDLVLVGGAGNEKSEITDLTSTPPNSISLAVTALSHNHESGESVQKVLWDQFDLQYRESSSDSWQNVVTTQDFDWKQDETTYIHSGGLSTYQYRSRYYNSATATYSDWSDTVEGTGLTRLQVGNAVEKVRLFSSDKNSRAVEDGEIIDFFNEVHDMVGAMNRRWWFLKDEYTDTTVEDTKSYDLPEDCERVHRLKYRYDDGANDVEYYLKYVNPTRYDYIYRDQDADSDDNLKHYTVDFINKKWKVGPWPENDGYTMTLIYFKKLADIDSYGDTLTIPLANLYIWYATAQVWRIKENEEKSTYYMNEFGNALKLLEQMRPKVSHPRQLKNWRGRKAMDRLYGDRRSYSDDYREKYY
jgi:hypothetical protein